jgi:hypothetical protein
MRREELESVSEQITPGELDARYSDPAAVALPWEQVRAQLAGAQVSWLTTVRPDGRPHVTPLLTVWAEDAPWFCTGAEERKARNLAEHDRVALTTGCNLLREGVDVVVEGRAERVREHGRLLPVAEQFEAKYGTEWHFDVVDGGFVSGGHRALVFRVALQAVFAFGKNPYSQTRWRMADYTDQT